MTDLDRLASLAEAATHDIETRYFDGEYWKLVCSCGWECWDQVTEAEATELQIEHAVEERAEFIRAASPAVVLALVGRQRELEAALGFAKDGHHDLAVMLVAKDERIKHLEAVAEAARRYTHGHSIQEVHRALAALDVDPPPTEVSDE
jgi:hypothetical protein